MPNDPTDIDLNSSPLTAYFMPRPRLNKVLDQASRCKLVYVVAGAGYGKTLAVQHYILQQEAVVRWVQLTDSDNIGSRYWESLTRIVSFDNPDLAVKLRELGFPETLARFKQFAEIIKTSEHRSKKTFLVLDDFHLIHSKQALTFAERCAHLQIPGACVIIISRKEPEINAVSLFSKGNATIVTEDVLRFTEEEVTEFFRLRDIPFSIGDLPRFLDATKGWALAVKLLSLVLERIPFNLDYALEAMKQNVFKLLETEAFNDFPDIVQKRLAQLALMSDLPLTLFDEIFLDAPLMQYTPQLTSFIWYDSFFSDYRVHPLYLEFLQSKESILSEDEKQDVYRKAAQWCFDNSFYTDAMRFCSKSRQYERMLDVLLSYPFKLPHDTCEFFLKILMEIDPRDEERTDLSVLLLRNLFIPLLYMGMGEHGKARDWSNAVIARWEMIDAPVSPYLLYTAYSNLAYIDTYTCTVTHDYSFLKHIKKAMSYYQSSGVQPVRVEGPFGVADIRDFACLVGEGATLPEFDEFVKTTVETSAYISQTYHFMYYGYDDLAACELAFFKNKIEQARSFAYNAVLKAREKKQHSIEMMAKYYLLRIAIHNGDFSLSKEIFKQMRAHLDNPDFWNRQLLYDLFAGSFYAHIGLHEMMPPWLALDEKDTTTVVRIPVRELIVCVRYYFVSGRYEQALTVLCNSYPRDPQDRFFFGELVLSLLLAVALLKTGDSAGAAREFSKAYEMSFGGVFEMPFIELGKLFHPLAAAVSEFEGSVIPVEWLRTTDRKASAYAKRTAFIAHSFKREEKIKDEIHLSEREREVLNDLFHGLSREEMAATRYLSINTINKTLQSLFIKLDVSNSIEALRTAIELNMVE